MQCPRCHDEYQDHVTQCATCGCALVSDGAPEPVVVEPRTQHLGRFHPAIVPEITRLLDRRGIHYELRRSDDDVEVMVSGEWRDDLRAELTMTWAELLGRVDPAVAIGLSSGGGSAPGWHDAPRGGYVDRVGRLVVEPGEVEEQETDAARVIGPALLTAGAIAAIAGWYLLDVEALVVIGVLLALIGVLTPR